MFQKLDILQEKSAHRPSLKYFAYFQIMDNRETVQLETSFFHAPCTLEEMQQLPGIWSRFYCLTFRGNDQKQVAKVYDQRNSDWQLITQNQTTLLEDFDQTQF